MRSFLSLLLFPFFFLGACQTSTYEPDPEAIGHEYFPLQVKDYRIYEVNETRYLNDQATTTQYQVRERVDTVFTDAGGLEAYRIIHSRRPQPTADWVDDSVIVVSRNFGDLRETRHNTKLVKMVFPVKTGKTWNANAFNQNGASNFRYAEVGAPFTVGGATYDQTVTVVQGDTEHLLEFDQREEVYAKDVGLVYKKYIRLNYCDNESICPYNRLPHPFIQEGIRREDKLISFGKMP